MTGLRSFAGLPSPLPLLSFILNFYLLIDAFNLLAVMSTTLRDELAFALGLTLSRHQTKLLIGSHFDLDLVYLEVE